MSLPTGLVPGDLSLIHICGFDLFVSDLRGQHNHLHGKAWIQHDGDAPFQALARNTPSLISVHEARLGLDRIATVSYTHLDVYKRQTVGPGVLDAAEALGELGPVLHGLELRLRRCV